MPICIPGASVRAHLPSHGSPNFEAEGFGKCYKGAGKPALQVYGAMDSRGRYVVVNAYPKEQAPWLSMTLSKSQTASPRSPPTPNIPDRSYPTDLPETSSTRSESPAHISRPTSGTPTRVKVQFNSSYSDKVSHPMPIAIPRQSSSRLLTATSRGISPSSAQQDPSPVSAPNRSL